MYKKRDMYKNVKKRFYIYAINCYFQPHTVIASFHLMNMSETWSSKCTLNHCLEWYKWVLTNFDHNRQWFNTLIPPSHESSAVYAAISRLIGPVRLSIRYTTPDIHCRDTRYECDGGIMECSSLLWKKHTSHFWTFLNRLKKKAYLQNFIFSSMKLKIGTNHIYIYRLFREASYCKQKIDFCS